ncbi:Neuronal PAS domain-containing protein 4 [Trichinella nelsoni]|uniref:Neuronal PAS domain-containing protein 4 n=1 Tax=Trichinella nelsoni TaxID=6336 RepID=A0A0V0S586_9BILA|nr:Neuronal PAS domain-containing protein 4 [Trichinella nelsoni]
MNSSLSNQQTKSCTNRETLQDTRKLQITSDDRCLLVNVCANIATIELPSSVLVLMVKRVSQSADTSTRGASKQRRALINYEIDQLKLYLPVCSTIRQRLFQLQVMSLACVFIRKYNYTSATLAFSCPVMQINSNSKEQRQRYALFDGLLPDLLMLLDHRGKVIYLAGSVQELTGKSCEELLGQGDSVYDLIDSRDHGTVQTILTSTVTQEFHDERVVLCRINTSSSTKRFAQDQCILIRSRIICQASCVASTQPSFVVTCTPVVMPTNVDALNVMSNPQIFHSIHEMDMRFISVDKIGCQLLGLQVDQMITLSWYSVLHPQDLLEAASKHKITLLSVLVCEGSQPSCACLVRLISVNRFHLWAHCVLILEEKLKSQAPTRRQILCIYQIVDEDQAVQLRANACWLYSWPSVIDFPQQPQPPTMMPTFNHLHVTTESKSLECRSLIDNPFLLTDEISTTKPPIDDLSNCMHSTFTDGRVMAKGEEPLVAFYSPLPDIESETIDRYLY